MSSVERLLHDLSMLIELTLMSGEHASLDAFADAFMDRALAKTCAANGLLFVRSPRAGAADDVFVALPARRAQFLVPTSLVSGAEHGILSALSHGRPALVPGNESTGQRAGFRGQSAPVFALRVPLADVALLELYVWEDGVLDERTGTVLASLSSWISRQIASFGQAREQAQLTKTLAESHTLLSTLLPRLPGMVWKADLHGTLTFVDDQARSVFGLPKTCLTTRAALVRSCLPEEDLKKLEQRIASAVAAHRGLVRSQHWFHLGADRHAPPIEVEEQISLEYSKDGGLIGQIGFLRALEPAETRPSIPQPMKFLNAVSHELRGLLFPIIALSDLLSAMHPDQQGQKEWREHAQMINQSGKQMLDLISELLELSRLATKRLRTDLGPLPPEQLAASVVDRFAAQTDQRQRRLRSQLHPTAENELIFAGAAAGRIAQLFLQFALEATSSGDLSITVGEPLFGAAPGMGEVLEIRVEATITAKEESYLKSDQLFEPFAASPAARLRAASEVKKERGLCLPLAKALARALGGDAQAKSGAGLLTLRAEIPSTAPAPDQPLVGRVLALVAPSFAEVMRPALALAALGARVSLFESAEACEELIRKGPIDLLIVIPEIAGLDDLARMIAERTGRPQLLSVMISNDHPPAPGFIHLPRPLDPQAIARLASEGP